MLSEFLAASDAERATAVMRKLQQHGTLEWVLTGGLAVEIHAIRCGLPSPRRTLNDIDFVVPRFDCIQESLGSNFLCRHIHPLDPPGRTIAQFIDPDYRLRVDVFRASEGLFGRTVQVEFPFGRVRLVSSADLSARLLRIVLQIANGTPVASKHADDLRRLLNIVDPTTVEEAWREHRVPEDPTSFGDACDSALELISYSPHLLITVEYSKNTHELCERCVPTEGFRLASAEAVLSILGHC